jgi:hypothetical protein
MMAAFDDLLPSAADCLKTIALAEAEKASASARQKAAAGGERNALLERLSKPSGVSDEERIKRAATIIKRAVDNGRTEVFVGRFNQQEPGWESTLTGLPRELYEF